MDKNQVTNFILDNESVTIPQLQKQFSATYAEIREVVDSLVADKKLKPGDGLKFYVVLSDREKAARAKAKLINNDPEYLYKLNMRPPATPVEAARAMRVRPAKAEEINICLMALWCGVNNGDITTALIQRRFSLPFTTSYRIREWMERNEYVEPYPSGKVLMTRDEFLEKFGNPGNDPAPYDLETYFRNYSPINASELDPYFSEPYTAFRAANNVADIGDGDDDDEDDDDEDSTFDFFFDEDDDEDDEDDEDEDDGDDDDNDGDDGDDDEGIIDADALKEKSRFSSFLNAIRENDEKMRLRRVTKFCSDILDEDDAQVYTVGTEDNKRTFRVFHLADTACVGDNGETYKALGAKDDAIKSVAAQNNRLCYEEGDDMHELYIKTDADNFLPTLIELFGAVDKIKSSAENK